MLYSTGKSWLILGFVVIPINEGDDKAGDGCVSVCADEKIHDGDYCDGCGLGYGLSRPEVLHKWEYEYLKSHPDYLKVWIRASADLSKFNSREMAQVFAK